MAMRPCLTSVRRDRARSSLPPFAATPAGSQKPPGACTPRSFSKARSGEVVSTSMNRAFVST
eukprot:13272059-Heterocapsa_arctica.AAC.1